MHRTRFPNREKKKIKYFQRLRDFLLCLSLFPKRNRNPALEHIPDRVEDRPASTHAKNPHARVTAPKIRSTVQANKRSQVTRASVLRTACRPAIAYSRVDTGRNPSAVPSSSNFPASHLGSELGLIAQSCRAFSSPPRGQSCTIARPGDFLPPSPPAEKATAGQQEAGKAGTGDGGSHAHRHKVRRQVCVL